MTNEQGRKCDQTRQPGHQRSKGQSVVTGRISDHLPAHQRTNEQLALAIQSGDCENVFPEDHATAGSEMRKQNSKIKRTRSFLSRLKMVEKVTHKKEPAICKPFPRVWRPVDVRPRQRADHSILHHR